MRGLHPTVVLAVLFSFTLSACTPAPANGTSFAATSPVLTTGDSTTAVDSGTASSTSDGSGPASTSSGSASSSGAGTGVLWDLGTPQDLGDPTPPGCKGKVDFLFALSRGPNMAQIQKQFIASFEPFITSIEGLGDEFEDFDFHIMVVDGDEDWGSGYCDDGCMQDGVCDLEPSYPCSYEPTSCDDALGAGTIFNAGRDAPNKHCGLAGGKRYLDNSNFGLQETFACIAQVGSAGRDDLGNALAQAVTTQRDTCNSGFLRDDALLVVVFIMTGDVLPGVDGIPQYWANALIDAKGGDLDAIVMLGMAGAGPFEKCLDYHDNRMCEMLALFPHRVYADPDSANYGPAFQETVDLIDVACAEFVPG